MGVEYATATLDSSNGTLIARLPKTSFVSVAEADAPYVSDTIEWHQAKLCDEDSWEILKPTARPTDPMTVGPKLTYVRYLDFGLEGIPHVVIVSSTGAWFTGSGEWRRQVYFASWLGNCLERMYGLPTDLWTGRVMPAVFPAMGLRHQAARKPLALAGGVPGTKPGITEYLVETL